MASTLVAPMKRACSTALDMMLRLRELRPTWQEQGKPFMDIGIGINSGVMTVGNMGSEKRFYFTVMGDNVNLGSRLEGLNKQYKTEILIGENTADLVDDAFLLREVDMVRVVGRRQPVRIYELLAKAGEGMSPEQEKAFKAYAAGLRPLFSALGPHLHASS